MCICSWCMVILVVKLHGAVALANVHCGGIRVRPTGDYIWSTKFLWVGGYGFHPLLIVIGQHLDPPHRRLVNNLTKDNRPNMVDLMLCHVSDGFSP